MVDSPAPLVGLSTYWDQAKWGSWDRPAAVLQAVYLDCVAQVGGRPVMLPPADGPGASPLSAASVAARLEALVLTGGADVDPEKYGEAREANTADSHPKRDNNELALLEAFLDIGKPVLGICRGTQIMNTFLGGTLHQHVPDLTGDKNHQPAPGKFGETKVHADVGSKVAAAMGEVFEVMCSHHQSIDRLGRGLKVTARSDDGLIEAVESLDADGPFLVGVQWHPEQSFDTRLFRALIDAC